MTYTASAFIASPAFIEIAISDALAVVAKANKQSLESTQKAFDLQVPNVISSVAELVAKAAEHCASEANAGKLWN